MAIENVPIEALNGSSYAIAADIVSGLAYQVVKLGNPNDGTGGLLSPATSANQDTAQTTLTSIDTYASQSTAHLLEIKVDVADSSAYLEDILASDVTQSNSLSSLASAVALRSGSAGVYQPGFPSMAIRDDALSAISGEADEGEFTVFRVDANGALWVQLAGALNASVDSIALDARANIGCDMNKNIDVDESEDAVKASAGSLYGFTVYNAAATVLYLKYYNATVASVTVGSTAPDLTIPIPAGAAGTFNFPHPVKFGTAITIAATTGLADNNSGAPGANELIVNTFYK